MEPTRLEAFYTQVQSFIDDVLDQRPPTVPGSEGRAAVEVVQAARISSATGRSVDLPASLVVQQGIVRRVLRKMCPDSH